MGDGRLGLQAAGGDPAACPISDAEQVRRIEKMPKEVGLLLIVAGIGGILLPGPVGTPFLVLGAVVLWPLMFGHSKGSSNGGSPGSTTKVCYRSQDSSTIWSGVTRSKSDAPPRGSRSRRHPTPSPITTFPGGIPLDLLLTTLLTSPMLGGVVGIVFALTLLGLLIALSVYAGLYYTVPRILLKWLCRRAIRVL